MRKLKIAERDFISLVISGAGLSSHCTLSPNPDWNEIFRYADEHALLGLLAESLSGKALKERCSVASINWVADNGEKVLVSLREALFVISLDIVKKNKRMNELLTQIFQYLDGAGVTAVLQKGQGVARHYPNPMMRMSGDIDLLVSEGDYECAKELLMSKCTKFLPEINKDKHCQFLFNDIEVEIHATEFSVMKNGTHERYRQWCEELFRSKAFDYFECGGVKIRVAKPEYDLFYTFLHFVKHYYYEGVGMKQLLDMKVSPLPSLEGKQRFNKWIEDFELTKEWNAVARLNLENDSLFLGLIMHQGNMGRNEKMKSSWHYMHRAWHMAKHDFLYALRYLPFSKRKFLLAYIGKVSGSWCYFIDHRIRRKFL